MRGGNDSLPTHVGVLYRSDRAAEEAWSGIAAGLARGLAAHGVHPQLVNAEPPQPLARLTEGWAAVIRRSRWGGMHAPEIRAVRRLTARVRGSSLRGADVIQLGSDFGIPFNRFVTYEDMTVRQLLELTPVATALGRAGVRRWLAAQETTYARAIGCCAASSWAADSIVRDYGVDPARVHVVGIGRNHDPRPVRRNWAKPRFLFVGLEWERKNGPLVVRAFERLHRQIPEAELHVVGGHPRLTVPGVVAHGSLSLTDSRQRERLRSLFETATCFVMPSVYEPFGIVYLEAAAAGVPFIGTTTGGVIDLADSGGGLLVPPTDENALLEAMLELSDAARAKTMGEKAAARADAFTWKAVAGRILQVLQAAG